MPSPRGKDKEAAREHLENMKKEQGQATMGMVSEDERSCTDPFCCVFFLVFVIAMIGVSGYAFANGDPQKFLTKYDSDGNMCGHPDQNKSNATQFANDPRDFTQYKYKYFSNLQSLVQGSTFVSSDPEPAYTKAVCVMSCPRKDQLTKCMKNDEHLTSCPGEGITNPVPFNTRDVMGFCIPEWEELGKFAQVFIQQMDNLAGGALTRYMFDLYESWPVLLGMAFGSLAITFLFSYLLQCLMAPLIYISVILLGISGAGFTGFTFYKWSQFPEGSNDKQNALIIGCIVGAITLIYLICICCLWNSISIGVAVLKVTTRFLRGNCCLSIFPLITYIVLIPVMAWWIGAVLYLSSIGEPKYHPQDMFARIEMQPNMTPVFWFYFCGILWIILFTSAVLQFTTIVAAVNWYFTGQGSDVEDVQGNFSVGTGFRWSFRYHGGTLSFGSFLIFVITLIKFIFEYFAKKAEALEEGEPTGAVKCLIWAMRCCVWCVDCCIRFITENAYIQTAIKSTSFCVSAHESFYMMVRNPGTFAATSTVGFIMTLIGKGSITAFVGWLTWLITGYALPNVEQPIVPGIAGAIMGFTTASLFLQMFDFTSLTILQCYLVNKESGGTIAAPEELKEHLDNWEKDEADFNELKRKEMIEGNNDKKQNTME